MTSKGPTDIDITVGRNVRLRRLDRGLSQSAVAKSLGVTFQQVQKYEKGTNRISPGRLVRIATALAVPITALLAPSSSEPRLDLICDSRSYRLALAFAAIADRGLRLELVEFIERVAAAASRERQDLGPLHKRRRSRRSRRARTSLR